MKKIAQLLKIGFTLFFMFAFVPQANSQILKKLGKRAEKAAERAVERRVEKEATEKTEEVLDSILEPGAKDKSEKKNPLPNDKPTNEGDTGGQSPNNDELQGTGASTSSGQPKTISVYSKFDFVPGDKVLFFEDFSKDFIGDFPSKWNTNGSGEVVTINDSPDKWLELLPGYNIYFIPDVQKLPEEYTIEFDLLVAGIDNKTSSTAGILVSLTDDDKFKAGNYYANAWLPIGQYGAFDIRMRNHKPGVGSEINSAVRADVRGAVLGRPHISIAVNKQRYRLWVNEKKYIDIPRFVPEGSALTSLKFNCNGLKDGKERLFIRNLKVAEGGLDLRRTLISEGRVSTNGILFDSGSSKIQPQSMGIIRQIFQVLQQEKEMHLKIIGHTDSDGEEATNIALSKKRAEAVKNALTSVYSITSDRLSTDGKGESEPLGDNDTVDGKSQNRRVEFIKQ